MLNLHVAVHTPLLYGPRRKKSCHREFPNNKGAVQPAHPRSLISAFVIRCLESIISRLATSVISIYLLVSVAWQAGLNLTLSETPKTDFVSSRPNYFDANNNNTVLPKYCFIYKTTYESAYFLPSTNVQQRGHWVCRDILEI